MMFPVLGCAASVGPLFCDAPVVWQVDDDRDIAEPRERAFNRTEYYARIFLSERVDRALSLPSLGPAANTNALDEVPNSTWFENRIGVRQVSPAEAAGGVEGGGPPRPPFQVAGGKMGGGTPGFLLRDVSGRKFLVKFDTAQNPELHSAAGAITNRIFWTLGYNVPSDNVFWFTREQLSVEPGAKYKNGLGEKQPIDDAMIEAVLRATAPAKDGSFRALASQLLDGKPKGGFATSGTRSDDANDRVPHQHRRELRGLRVFAAWVGHTDMKEDNTLDMYVTEGGRRFLRHYLLDFDAAFDAHAVEMERPEDGWEYFVDWGAQTKATLAFGLWKRPWEDVKPTRWPSIGAFTAEPFEPEVWQETYPYAPFFEMNADDAYWAAKLVMRFDRPMLEAIVAAGRLSEPSAASYLIDTLLARRNRIGRAFLEAVSALDHFELEPGTLCMTDLSVQLGLAAPGRVEWLHGARVVRSFAEGRRGRLCVGLPKASGYTIFRVRVRRGATARPAMEIHFMSDDNPRILGIVRSIE
jgi:hypothetical protein